MTEFQEPPEIKRIDFSEAHFLDHWPWECRKYEYAKGGWKTHLEYAWDYKWSGRVRAATKCKIGWHSPTQVWESRKLDRPNLTWTACIDCWKPLSEKQPA